MGTLNFSVFKKRPVLTTGIVLVGGLVVYLLFFRAPSNPQSPAQVGYTDANVNAASGLAQMQMQAQMQGQQIQGQLAALQIQGQNDLNLAQVQENTQEMLAAFSFKAAQLDNARDMYGIQKQSELQMYGIQTSAEISKLQISSQLEALHVQAQQDIAQQQIMTNGQLALGAQAAAIQMAGIQSQENIAHYSMDTTLGLQKMISEQSVANTKLQNEAALALNQQLTDAQIALGKQNVDMAKIAAERDKYVQYQQSDAQRQGNKWGGLSSMVDSIAGIFGGIF